MKSIWSSHFSELWYFVRLGVSQKLKLGYKGAPGIQAVAGTYNESQVCEKSTDIFDRISWNVSSWLVVL